MKLQTKLILATVAAGVLVALTSLRLVLSASSVTMAANDEARATKIVNTLSELRFLTFENLLTHDQTSRAQWEIKNAELADLLVPAPDATADELATLQEMATLSGEIKPQFDRLVATYSTTPSLTADQQHLQERLASQILVKQQTQVSDMLKLASAAQDNVIRINRRASYLVGSVIVFMVAVTIGNFLLFTRTVTDSLKKLQKGAQEVGARHFAYRIKPRHPHDEFGQVARAFNKMAEATGRLDQAKSEFIVLATHQLKTPLGELRGYTENLLIGAAGDKPEQRQQYLELMQAVLERASHLVNNLLDISQIERGKIALHLTPVSLRALTDDSIKDFEHDIAAKGLTLTVDDTAGAATVMADRLIAGEALRNIIHNAVKFTAAGGITVRLATEGNVGIITIADTGPGIGEAVREELFRDKGILGKPLMSGGGANVGLYIANRFVAVQHGTLRLLPSDTGAVFEVTLPLTP